MKSFYLIKPYFIENRRSILLGLIFLICVDMLQLFIPRIIKQAIDNLTTFQADAAGLLVFALYIVGAALLIGLFRFGWRLCLIGLSRRIEEGLRNRLFAHIQTLSSSYFNTVTTGDLMAHSTNDISNIRMATGMGMVAMTDAIFLSSASIGFMMYINLQLTLFALIPMPLIVLSTRLLGGTMHVRYKEAQASFSELTETVRERFSGIRVIKAFNRERNETAAFTRVSKSYIQRRLDLIKVTGMLFPLMILFTNLSLVIVLYLGGRQTIRNFITPGDFVAFISYLNLLTWPMMAMGWVMNLMQRGGASLERIGVILNTPPEIIDHEDALPLETFQGGIRFENVSFSYEPTSGPALSEITFDLKAGRVLGITGPPGSGKTTLLNLLPRLYDPNQGRILIDGEDIRTLKLKSLRSILSYVPQEPFLFGGAIRDNIVISDEDPGDAELIKAAKNALLYNTLTSFPKGFETITGEKGVTLSGGQKQRVVLARALLRNAPVLILDDPVSQVDMETGAGIINRIRSLPMHKTVIIASHRFSALQFADQIIVLDRGRITESGTHDQLIALDGYYAKTYRLQTLEKDLNANEIPRRTRGGI